MSSSMVHVFFPSSDSLYPRFVATKVFPLPPLKECRSSYAFIDVFAMMVWADISRVGSEARQYGIGMLFITVAIYIGFILSGFFTFHLSTLLAVSLLILSAFLIGSAKEPATSPAEYMRWLVRR